MSKVAKRRNKSKKWEDPKVIAENPEKIGEYREFIEATEGTENKGGDPRVNEVIKTTMSEKDYKRQQAAMKRLKERGWKTEDE